MHIEKTKNDSSAKNREYPGNDDLRRLLFERRWQPGLDRLLHLRGFFASFAGECLRLIGTRGRFSRISRGAVMNGQADRLGQQQGQDAYGEAKEAGSA